MRTFKSFLSFVIGLCFIISFSCNVVFAQANGKANVRIIATGGTIAGSGDGETSSKYTAGTVLIDNIIKAVPALNDVANVSGEQLVNIGSQDMTEDVWIKLSNRVNELMDDDSVDGIVITHGTDTMDETAYFLSITTKGGKPVVLTGAMRPSTHISADGPSNLYDAVCVAASDNSSNYGVLVVFNGKILKAADVEKVNTVAINAFEAPNSGPAGFVYGNSVVFYGAGQAKKGKHPNATRNSEPQYNIKGVTSFPKVGIVYGYAGIDSAAIEGLVKAGYKGIVYAGVGNGNIHKNVIDYLSELTTKGVVVMRSTRVLSGGVFSDGEVDDAKYGFIPAYFLSPQKARIELMLRLCK